VVQPVGPAETNATPYAPPVREVPVAAPDSPVTAAPVSGPAVRAAKTPYDEPLPPAIAAAAAGAGFGDLVKVFRPRRSNQALVIGLLVVSIALIWCIAPIYVLWLLFRTPNLNARVAARRVYVFQKGLIVAAKPVPSRPTDLDVWPWAEVATVFQKIVKTNTFGMWTGTYERITATRNDGSTFTVTNFWDDHDDLRRRINVQVTAALLAPMRRALASGQAVQFGTIIIDRAGVNTRAGTTPWAEVETFDIIGASFRIIRRGGARLGSVAMTEVPNPSLLYALAKELRTAAAG
jgi:hypothetical protein